jgi:hypothetical protein
MAICLLITAFIVRVYRDPSEQYDPVTLWHRMGVLPRVGVLLSYLACISLPFSFATAGVTVVSWADLQGEAVDLRSVFSRIGRVLLRLVILSLSIGVMSIIGGMFFLVPGIVVFIFMSFAVPVLVIEDATVSTALRRGTGLASTQLGALLGLYATVLCVTVIVGGGIGYLASTVDYPWWLGITTFWALFVPLASILIMVATAVIVCLYSDVREKGEEMPARRSA